VRREVLAAAVAAVAEEVGQRAHHRGLGGAVEPDLQHHAAGGELLGMVAREVDVADDPRTLEVGHRDGRVRVEGVEVRVTVIAPAAV